MPKIIKGAIKTIRRKERTDLSRGVLCPIDKELISSLLDDFCNGQSRSLDEI